MTPQVRGNPADWEGVDNGDGVICLGYYHIATERTFESTAFLTSIQICPLVSAGGPQEFGMPRKDLVEYAVQVFVEYMGTLGIGGYWLQPGYQSGIDKVFSMLLQGKAGRTMTRRCTRIIVIVKYDSQTTI